ncbi:MAG TPA: pyridoxal-phosphate dependent enzyme [Candidatus Binatia bacterium]|nr:pyridoxal-phosphate dependent enzyme [Candidatus Binatia bacterium]
MEPDGPERDPVAVLDLARIEGARRHLTDRVHVTPILGSASAARVAAEASGRRLADDRLLCKAEHLQKTGSFKVRAALAKLAALPETARRAGIVTVTAGNAGQAYAWAARTAAIPATIVMPLDAVGAKVEACRGYGAEVVLAGRHVGETFEAADRLVRERGLTFCHPFDDPDVIAGNGSLGLEILEAVPDLDVLVVPVGGGGLVSGIAAAVRQRAPGVRVYGVEPEGSNAVALARAAGHPVEIVPRSVADGLGAPHAGMWTTPLVRHYLEDIVLVSDTEILAALRFALERTKQVLEPAGAAGLAALLAGRIPYRDGERVVVVLSGGNVDLAALARLLDAAPGSAAGRAET